MWGFGACSDSTNMRASKTPSRSARARACPSKTSTRTHAPPPKNTTQRVAEGEAAEDDFADIMKLQEFGIGAADLKKAKDGGFNTCESLLMVPRKVRLLLLVGCCMLLLVAACIAACV
jgi:hypothetical protein